jgi:hypothetical protein
MPLHANSHNRIDLMTACLGQYVYPTGDIWATFLRPNYSLVELARLFGVPRSFLESPYYSLHYKIRGPPYNFMVLRGMLRIEFPAYPLLQ